MQQHHAGVYAVDKVAKGILLQNYVTFGDCWSGLTFVTHAGGRSQKSTMFKKCLLQSSQTPQDRGVQALMNAMKAKSPVLVLMDKAYPLAVGLNLRGKFNTVGFYQVMAAWPIRIQNPETRQYLITYKFLFQWIQSDLQTPWFETERTRPVLPPLPLFHCGVCLHQSVRPYVDRECCLNVNCTEFTLDFHFEVQKLFEGDKDLYRKDFLEPRFKGTLQSDQDGRKALEKSCDELCVSHEPEFMCPKPVRCSACNAVSPRTDWTSWECTSCRKVKVDLTPSRGSEKELIFENKNRGKPAHGIRKSSNIVRLSVEGLFAGTDFEDHPVDVYLLPYGGGRIVHIKAEGAPITSAARLAAGNILDSLLFPEADPLSEPSYPLPLRREFLKNHKVEGFRTNQFMTNYGAEYDFAASTPTRKLISANKGLVKAVQQLDTLLPESGFNEMLHIGYLKDELSVTGPIASWSFGSSATMTFRLRDNPNEHLPQCCDLDPTSTLDIESPPEFTSLVDELKEKRTELICKASILFHSKD
ncbi:hypothetical protein HDU67_006690 [Dinochytrium kinnereticum]|nr:hypothetical protein HDU67_006690 [Dinochytrium kinnereticum]